MGSPIKDNLFLKGVVNGWQISGITQLQSGINLLPNTPNGVWNLGTNGAVAANGFNISANNINGTGAVPLMPLLTCDPSANLRANQFVNGACFALPRLQGANGPIVPPEVFGPAFFNSDLSLFKNFQISESKKFQFRFSAYNFLNHPLWTFRNGSNNLNLNFNSAGALDNPNFGVTTEKQGHRIIQLALKYYF
jgi:hypothetical protein